MNLAPVVCVQVYSLGLKNKFTEIIIVILLRNMKKKTTLDIANVIGLSGFRCKRHFAPQSCVEYYNPCKKKPFVYIGVMTGGCSRLKIVYSHYI